MHKCTQSIGVWLGGGSFYSFSFLLITAALSCSLLFFMSEGQALRTLSLGRSDGYSLGVQGSDLDWILLEGFGIIKPENYKAIKERASVIRC